MILETYFDYIIVTVFVNKFSIIRIYLAKFLTS